MKSLFRYLAESGMEDAYGWPELFADILTVLAPWVVVYLVTFASGLLLMRILE